MKAVLFSLLLAVIIAVVPTNTEDVRDRRQTETQCEQMIVDNLPMIFYTIEEVSSTCTNCSTTCRSLLNNLKRYFGCCFESYGGSDARRGLSTLLGLCNIPTPGPCNHASSVVITFSTIAIFSIIAYF